MKKDSIKPQLILQLISSLYLLLSSKILILSKKVAEVKLITAVGRNVGHARDMLKQNPYTQVSSLNFWGKVFDPRFTSQLSFIIFN